MSARRIPAEGEGIWCWGCARRFVAKGQPTSGPLDAVRWIEGLCGKLDCAMPAGLS